MAVIRVNKTADYTVMSNTHFREKEMSLKAKGLLSLMLSLPDNWDYSIKGLCAICKENESSIKGALRELKQLGYLVIKKRMPNETKSKRIEYEYNIYECPQDQPLENQGVENQPLENQPLENQGVENPPQLNTKLSNTKLSNTDDKKKERKTTYDEILSAIANDDLKELYLEYIKMRKMIKAPMTDRALKLLINKVNDLEPHSIERQKRLLDNAIMNNWKSVYPLKDNDKPQFKQTMAHNYMRSETTPSWMDNVFTDLDAIEAGLDEEDQARADALMEKLKEKYGRDNA